MILSELLKDLTYGELARLKIGNFVPGEFQSEPDPVRYEQLLSHINLGLTEIYKRFFLRSREIYVQLYSHIAVYTLDNKYAQTNTASTEPYKYIMDTVDDPFDNDTLKIEEVYDEGGNKLPLNDINEDLSVYTPSYRSIQVPYPQDDITYAVQYRAKHPPIRYTDALEPENVEIALPNSLHEALLLYVAYRAFSSKGGDQGVEGNDYWQRFERSCEKVNEYGLEIQGEPGNNRFDDRGWV